MAHKYLARGDAPFGDAVWDNLDSAMIEMAKSILVGRRLLPVRGPFGLGLTCVPLGETEVETGVTTAQSLPLATLLQDFTLSRRALAAYEREGVVLNRKPVEEAARQVAQMEDRLIFYGTKGIDGLMEAPGTNSLQLLAWDEVGTAAGAIMQAITQLDENGFHGPYSLALAPERYNQLFRLYPHGRMTELDHIRTMVTQGIFKAPLLKDGGVLISRQPTVASLILGQDMTIGFVGPTTENIEFYVTETLTLHIRYPQGVCVLQA